MAVIDSLLIEFGIDSKKLDSGLKGVESKINSSVGMIMKFVAPLAGALTFGKLFGDYTTEADKLGKFAASIGENIQTIDAWGESVKQAGGTAEGFQGSIKSLNEKLAEASLTGKGATVDLLKAFGVPMKDAEGNIRAASEVLLDLSGAAESMDKAQFAGLAKKLGLDSGTIMLLQSGRLAVEDLVSANKELAYTQRDAEVTAQYNRSMQDMQKSFRSVAAIILRIVTPAITAIAEHIGKLFRFLNNHGPFVKAVFVMIAAAITAVLIPALYALAAAILANPLTWIAAAIIGLALLFDDLWTHINGGESAFAGLWEAMGFGKGTIDEIRTAFELFKTDFTAGWESATADVKKFMDYFNSVPAEPGWDAIKGSTKSLVQFFSGDLVGAIDTAWAAMDNFTIYIGGMFVALWELLIDIFAWIDEKLGIIDKVKGAIDSVKGFAGDAVDSVTGAAKEAVGSVKNFVGGVGDNISDFLGFSDDSAMTAAAVPGAALAGGTVNQDNSTEVVNNVSIAITATSSDPQAIGAASQAGALAGVARGISNSTGTPIKQ